MRAVIFRVLYSCELVSPIFVLLIHFGHFSGLMEIFTTALLDTSIDTRFTFHLAQGYFVLLNFFIQTLDVSLVLALDRVACF